MENEESLVTCETTKGTVTIKLIRKWSPHGYDRAVELFQRHFYDGVHFFRVVKGFLTQFGISYSDDKELQKFARKQIPDDPKPNGNPQFEPGFVSYAGSGKNSRTSQLFISYGSAKSLGTQPWETPIGKVIEGMEAAKNFHSYGDIPPFGKGPDQQKIHGHPEYIADNFPLTDKILQCHVERIEGGDIAGELQLDAEEEAREKHLREKKPKIPEQRHRDLRNPEMIAAQNKMMSQDSNTPVVAAGAIVVLLVLGIIFVLLKGRKKIVSKTN